MGRKASVIIPVYNAENTLRRCVELLVLGTEQDIEVILCEDRSPDGSWALCQKLEKEFNNVICVRNEANRGVSFTRNQGLKAANGEYILFVDSDDWVSARYVQELLALAQNNPDALPICGHHFIDKVGSARRDYIRNTTLGAEFTVFTEEFFDLCDRFLLQQLWNKIFRRDVIETHHIRFDESQSMGEDFQFVLDYMEAIHCKKCVIINEPLYYYIRWHNSSLMSQFGFINNHPEFARMEQLARIAGPGAEAHKDAMIAQSKRNYIYHIVRSPNHGKQEKLNAIERIMSDGQAQRYYRQQQILHTKERLYSLKGTLSNLCSRVSSRFSRKALEKRILRFKAGARVQDVTLISQNCIGGVIYYDLGMPFLSPTINAFIPQPDFVRFVLDLRHYMEQQLILRWGEEYPIGTLGDIEIHFMHYDTCQQAREYWERRKTRINYDKIFVLSTDRDGFDDAAYELWKQIPYPKVLFTANPNYTEDAVFYPEYTKLGMVPDLIPKREFYKDDIVKKNLL